LQAAGVDLDFVIENVARYFQVDVDDLHSARKAGMVTRLRQ
jgi:chromosomal replication initiation ATPase DnaA